MRLFAAIDPPPEAVADLDRAVRRKGAAVIWAPTEQWHLTTAFYGEVSGPVLAELMERLEHYASRSRPMSLQLAGAGCFPRRPNAARVLWAGLDGELDVLARLAGRCDAAGRRCGLTMQRRKYVPHLTLARTRAATDLSGRLAELWDYRGPQWTASTLRLVRSTLGAQVRHETLAEWPLAAVATS